MCGLHDAGILHHVGVDVVDALVVLTTLLGEFGIVGATFRSGSGTTAHV